MCYTLPRNFVGKLSCLTSNQGTQLNEVDVNNRWYLFELTGFSLLFRTFSNRFRLKKSPFSELSRQLRPVRLIW